MRQILSTIRSSIKRTNKAPSVPSMPPPAAMPPAPTADNSEEVKKQRAMEEQRQKNARGLGSTSNTDGGGVSLKDENIDKPAAKTLLGE